MQAAFLPQMRASDNIIIVQEVIYFLNHSKTKQSHFILKMDMEKAFDRMEWSFIRAALIRFNFPPRIINIIMACITTSSLSILINGCPTPFFF